MTFTQGVCDGPGWLDGGSWFGTESFSKYDFEEGFNFGLYRSY